MSTHTSSPTTSATARRVTIPARVRTDAALYLPRLLLIGATIALIGAWVGLTRTPGDPTLRDLAALALAGGGLALVAISVRPDEGNEALATQAAAHETLVVAEAPSAPALRLVANMGVRVTGEPADRPSAATGDFSPVA